MELIITICAATGRHRFGRCEGVCVSMWKGIGDGRWRGWCSLGVYGVHNVQSLQLNEHREWHCV